MGNQTIIDLFAGPGGWDEGLRMIGRTDVLGIEWDESACLTAEAAGHRRLRADVSALNPRDCIGAEGLIASPPCFVAGSPVVTERAVLPIEEVRVGDRVLTHAGRWCRVESTGSKVAETVTVKGQGTSGITCTPDHRFYTRTYRTWVSGRTRARVEEWGDPTWTPATELGGSRWAIPATAAPVTWSAPIDPWLVGRWLADGWCNLGRGEVLWAIGDEKLDEFKARCNLPVAYAAMDGCHRVTLCGARDLATWLAANFGSGAHRKTIPGVVLGASETARRALLDGYLSGDSHRVDDHARKAVTVSACLATGVRLLAAGLGLAVSVTVNRPSATKTMPDGRVVNQRPWYAVTLRDQRARRFLHLRDGHWWGRVRSIEPSPPQRVYDIQVADDHSYVVDGIVVHNCQAWSLAGRRGGEEDRAACHELADRMAAGGDSADWRDWTDDRSPLVCQPVRWVRELRPEWIALEEVPAVLGLWEHLALIFRAWGYHVWVGVLNAADYGVPQTRKRAILLASRTRKVHRPTPTHSRVPSMFTAGWVSMADALGWGFDNEPSATVSAGGGASGGPEPFANHAWRKRLAATVTSKVDRNRVVMDRRTNSRAADGTPYPTPPVTLDRPAPTITVQEAGVLQSFPADYPWQGLALAEHVRTGRPIVLDQTNADEVIGEIAQGGVRFTVTAGGKDGQILDGVVRPVSVDVMHHLAGLRSGDHAVLRGGVPPSGDGVSTTVEVGITFPALVRVERVTRESPLLPVPGAEATSDGFAFTVVARWLGGGNELLDCAPAAKPLVMHEAQPLGGVLPVATFDLASSHISSVAGRVARRTNSRTKQYESVGNAVPPRLAAHVLAGVMGGPHDYLAALEGLGEPATMDSRGWAEECPDK